MKRDEIIAQLLKSGAKEIKNLTINSVNITKNDTYVSISLGLDNDVDVYLPDEEGGYAKDKSNLIFLTTYSISGVFRNIPALSFLADYIIEIPDALKVILNGAKINILQQEFIQDGDNPIEYNNPFSTKDAVINIDHSVIINDIINVSLGEFGKRAVELIQLKMLGIDVNPYNK